MTRFTSLLCLNYFCILVNTIIIVQTQGRLPIDYKNHIWESPSRFRRQLGSEFDPCGLIYFPAIPRILDGETVYRGDYPWLVALFLNSGNETSFQCSGTLVSKQHVLTAAHCTVNKNPNDFVLKIGIHNLHEWEDENIILAKIKNIQYHPEFEISRVLERDITILVMENPIEYSQYILPVCLWKGSDDLSNIVGQRGTVVGWSKGENRLTTTPVPKKNKISIVSTDTCRASRFHLLTNDMTICAGDRNKTGPFHGDSGGGLYIQKNGRWMIRGIGSQCIKNENSGTCNFSEYVIFTDAAKYNSWIKEVIDVYKSTSSDINDCILPERPISGSYSVHDAFSISLQPGDTVPEYTALLYSCDNGAIHNITVTVCAKGRWNQRIECRNSSSSLRLISRKEWLAQPPAGSLEPISPPAHRVIIIHTSTEPCTDQESCVLQVRTIQTFHLESRSWYDIGYNFLVGGDGVVYEGRGWDKVGAHTKGYNENSIGVAFIGTFNDRPPSERQLKACRLLLEEGLTLGKISGDYQLYGHRQFIPTFSPGDALFAEISTWPHFANKTSVH